MPRKARVEFPGAVYHLLDRGDQKPFVYSCEMCRESRTAPYFLLDYNQRHELFEIRGDNPIATFTRDAAGNVTQLRMDWALGSPTNYTYDALNRVTALEQGNATGIFARSHYRYDNVGREVATWRDEEGRLGEHFSFSVTNQITNVSYGANQVWTGNPTNAAKTQAYAYTADKLNRQSVTENGVVTN